MGDVEDTRLEEKVMQQRPTCPECGPGYHYGDEGCRHTPPEEEPKAIEQHIHIEVKMVEIKPGDQLLVMLPPGTTAEVVDMVAKSLREQFPKAGFYILAGVIGVGLMPPNTSAQGLILPHNVRAGG